MQTPSPQPNNNIEANFIESAQGKLFSLFFPAQGVAKGCWLYVPPFAEEMNRSRSIVAQQARELSAAGYHILILDLFGTGESEGDFTEASVSGWISNIHDAATWLEEKTGLSTGLWGCRLGATLAMYAANEQPKRYKNLLLWQPVLQGKTFVTQYLRLRVAYLMARDLPAEKTNEMRDALASGEKLEVAGYLLTGELMAAIDALQISECTALTKQKIHWHENILSEEKPLSMISRKAIEKLQSQDCQVNAEGFVGPSFWQSHERVVTPTLIANTMAFLEKE